MPGRGRFGPSLVTNSDGMETTLGEPAILITDRKVYRSPTSYQSSRSRINR